MTDDQIRALVREAIARHLGQAPAGRPAMPPATLLPPPGGAGFGVQAAGMSAASLAEAITGRGQAGEPPAAPVVVVANAPGGVAIAAGPGASVQVHISHAVFAVPPARDGGHDGPCATDPAADCTHCGFCQSYGH